MSNVIRERHTGCKTHSLIDRGTLIKTLTVRVFAKNIKVSYFQSDIKHTKIFVDTKDVEYA